MEITIKDNKIILIIETTTYEVNDWFEVQRILEEYLKSKEGK